VVKVRVTESDIGDDDTDELRELGWEQWENEWSGLGWRNEAGSFLAIQMNNHWLKWHMTQENAVPHVQLLAQSVLYLKFAKDARER